MVTIGMTLPSLCFHLCHILLVPGASSVASASTSYMKGSCFLSKIKSRIDSKSSAPSRYGRGRRLRKYSESVAIVKYLNRKSKPWIEHWSWAERTARKYQLEVVTTKAKSGNEEANFQLVLEIIIVMKFGSGKKKSSLTFFPNFSAGSTPYYHCLFIYA